MEKFIVTNVRYLYDEGMENNYTNVEIHFQNVGQDFTLSGKVTVNRNEYEAASGVEGVKNLALTKIVHSYGKDLA